MTSDDLLILTEIETRKKELPRLYIYIYIYNSLVPSNGRHAAAGSKLSVYTIFQLHWKSKNRNGILILLGSESCNAYDKVVRDSVPEKTLVGKNPAAKPASPLDWMLNQKEVGAELSEGDTA